MEQSFSAEDLAALSKLEGAVAAAATYVGDYTKSGQALEVHRKEDKTPVMNLDIESQRVISEELADWLPIIGEEDDESHQLVETESDYILIDPIDGTTNCKRHLHSTGGQVGFGPIVGLVASGQLKLAVYYNIPTRQLFSAVKGGGCYTIEVDLSVASSALPELTDRQQLRQVSFPALGECGVLFSQQVRAEMDFATYLRENKLVDTTYRFGGFGSDCCRLAQGLEQIEIQLTAYPWDFVAVLFAVESGLDLLADPLGGQLTLEQWGVRSRNPALLAPSQHMEVLVSYLKDSIRSG